MRKSVFIGSSSEGVDAAKALQYHLDHYADAVLWTDNVFKLSQSNIENLMNILDSSDYGVFVLTPDDIVASRGTQSDSPRDNVIFELGLFAGRLGMKKTYIVHPRTQKPRIPTDLLGITLASYNFQEGGNLISSLSPASTLIQQSMSSSSEEQLKDSKHVKIHMSWEMLCADIAKIGDKIRRSPHDGGFMPDLIIGVSRGGIIIADLLSRYLGGNIPVQCLWADRYMKYPQTLISTPENDINAHFSSLLKNERLNNILLVDDISRPGENGSTILLAQEYIESIDSNLVIRTLVLTIHKEALHVPDYYASRHGKKKYRMPFSVLG